MSSTSVDNCIKYSNPDEKELSMVFNFHHLKVDYKNGDKWTMMDFDFKMLKDMILEINNIVNSLSDLKENKEVCKSALKHTILVNEVNNVIKTKLVESRDVKSIGLNDKQFKAIINLYMQITEEVMTLKQINYLKTITKKQASEVIVILNSYKRNMK